MIILALGIGASTTAMSVAATVLHNPLPVRDDSRLVLVRKTLQGSPMLVPFSYAEIGAWREASRTLFNQLLAWGLSMCIVGGLLSYLIL